MKERFRFRVWNGKEMLYKGGLGYDGNQLIEDKGHIIMQCTGLKDKNGKLIYEGDIIVIPNLYPFYDYANRQDMKQSLNETEGIIKGKTVLNYIGIIEWIYSSWQYTYHCVNPKKNGISEGINSQLNENGYEEGEITEYEIIGNIYKNKELLEGR